MQGAEVGTASSPTTTVLTANWDSGEAESATVVSNSPISSASHQAHLPQTSHQVSGTLEHAHKPSSPLQSRYSLDFVQRNGKKRESSIPSMDRRDTTPSIRTESASVVDASFDENVLHALMELDCAVPLLLDRIKQSMVSCRDASVFLKKRATLEEEYGRNLQKLARNTSEVYAMGDGKAGTFVTAWQSSMKIHETMGDNRIRFAQRLNEMSEELANLAKEVDKNRKQTKELAGRYERALQESEGNMDKSKLRFDSLALELERVLLAKEGESLKDAAVQRTPGGAGAGGKRVIGKAVTKGGLLLKGKSPVSNARMEDEIRARMSTVSDAYRKTSMETQAMRQEYFNFQLPRILRALKECADEVDLGTQYHLTRYAFLFESIVLSDGQTLIPDDTATRQGLKTLMETMDNRADFKMFMQNYAYARGNQTPRGPRREGPPDEGYLPPIPPPVTSPATSSTTHHWLPGTSNQSLQTPTPSYTPKPTFGVDLAEQMERDGLEVPGIVRKCCEAIERNGLHTQGLYRVGGTMSKVTKLKELLDRDMDSVDLDTDEWSSEISNVTSVLKLWFRDLPDPLLTSSLHQSFLEASSALVQRASIYMVLKVMTEHDNDRLRQIRLHERVNELPDANYATLKYFMGHLHRVAQEEDRNAMSISNISIVFGPTLFPQIVSASNAAVETALQNKAIETILVHYKDIFVDETDGA